MKQKILADTSVWIEYFRGNDKITSYIEDNIYMNGIVLTEIIQGIRSEKNQKNSDLV